MSKETCSAVLREHWEKVALGASALLLVVFFAYSLLFASSDVELRDLEEKCRAIDEALRKNPIDVGARPDYRREFNAPWQPPVEPREFKFPIALDWLPFVVESCVIVYRAESVSNVPNITTIKVKILPTPVVESVTAATDSGVTLQWKIDAKLPPPNPDKEEWATPSHYVVDRREKGKGEFATVAKEVKDLKFVDKDVEAMTEYEYRVTAVSVDPSVKKALGTPSEAKVVKTASNLKIAFSGMPTPGDRPSIEVTVSLFKDDVWHAGPIAVTHADQVKDKWIHEGEVLNGAILCAEKHAGDQKCNKSFEVKSKIKLQKIEYDKDFNRVLRCKQCKKVIRTDKQSAWRVTYLDEEGLEERMWMGDKGPLQFTLCSDCHKQVKPAQPAPKDVQPKAPPPKEQPPAKIEEKSPKPESGKHGENGKKPIR